MNKKKQAYILSGVLAALVLFFSPLSLDAQFLPAVELREGGSPEIRLRLSGVLTQILEAINKHQDRQGNLNEIRNYCSKNGFESLKDLVVKNHIYAHSSPYRTNLTKLSNSDTYEVRGITVWIKYANNEINPYRNLIFTIEKELVVYVRYDIVEHDYYGELGEKNDTTISIARVKAIRKFLELFRTAYNTKNIDFLEKVFSGNALIIVGRVPQVQVTHSNPGRVSVTSNTDEVELIIRPRDEYLKRLKNVIFKENRWIDVLFDPSSIAILRDNKYPEVYGINLQQRWNSTKYNSTEYNDYGYLFLLIDFENESEPIIHVRAWQQGPVEPRNRINKNNFLIGPS